MTKIGIFACSFALGMIGAWFMSRYAYRIGLIDLPNARSSHSLPTPRGGGIGILMAFVLGSAVLQLHIGVWCPAALLAILSFFDDGLGLSPKMRLVFQFAGAITVVAVAGVTCENRVFSIFLMIFWPIFIVSTTNFYNFMDGINGISGITGLVGFLLISLFAYLSEVSPPPILLSSGMALACLGFLPFNVPKARVFMGDVGSILLGFVFAILVYLLTTSFADFLCLITFIFPFYADAMTTLFIRLHEGDIIVQAHRRHLYQVLANEFSYPHLNISIGYGLAQLLFGLIMIGAWRIGLLWQILFISLLTIVYVGCMILIRKHAKTID